MCKNLFSLVLKAKPLKENDPSSPWRNIECPNGELVTEEFEGVDTLDKLLEFAMEKYAEKDCKSDIKTAIYS